MKEKILYNDLQPKCACAVGLDLLGDRWSLIIVRDLFKGYTTYSDFLRKASEGIASNILNDRLKKLVSLGIIDFRKKESDRKVKEYYLTDAGIDLYPVIYSLKIGLPNMSIFSIPREQPIGRHLMTRLPRKR